MINRKETAHGIPLRTRRFLKDNQDNLYGYSDNQLIRTTIKKINIVKGILTPKQLEIYKLLLESGYYKFPRETNVRKLADIENTNVTTIVAHIQKIESKLFNIILKNDK